MQRSARFIAIVLIMVVLAIVACGGSGSKPTFQPIPTPTTPPGFISYSDELSTFSIKYPTDWQLNLSQMTEIEEGMKEFIQGKVEFSTESIGIVFMAYESNFDYGVNITVESLPFEMSTDEYYEASAKLINEAFPSNEVHRVAKMDVGGRIAILDESTFEASEISPELTGILGQTQLTFVQGKTAWVVTCDYPAEVDFANTCESVVRTIRVLE